MLVARPTTPTGVLDAFDELPGAHPLAGGTDFMVEVNFRHRYPTSVVCLRRVEELQGYSITDDVVLGAGTTWTEIENDLVEVLPALAAAARTVGSPQMRNAGTVGGNVGTASPAGDGLPVLAATDATVVLARRGSTRELPLVDFVTGVSDQLGEVVRASGGDRPLRRARPASGIPISDRRGTAGYRAHAVGVIPARALERCLDGGVAA